MNRRGWMVGAVGVVALAFIAGVVVYKDRTAQQAVQAVQAGGDALVRAHAPVFGNPQAKVTIVEFFDPSCETCRAFYPLVKSIVNASWNFCLPEEPKSTR
jgi:protein-disulfide isomerase